MAPDWLNEVSTWQGVLIAIGLALAGHLLVRLLRQGAESLLRPSGASHEEFVRRFPKAASIITLSVSAVTFVIYFYAIGLLLASFGANLGAYLATATVVGLAVGFGSQGLVQDIVVGMTLIFSDVLDVGDMVEISGQTGRVYRIGLRFTTIVNFRHQEIFIPNRNIALIGRYGRGYARAFVDVQLPNALSEERLTMITENVANALAGQHRAVILTTPEVMGYRSTGDPSDGGWQYLRLKFKVWPGETAIIEHNYRQRLLAAIRSEVGEYPDWMISITLRAR